MRSLSRFVVSTTIVLAAGCSDDSASKGDSIQPGLGVGGSGSGGSGATSGGTEVAAAATGNSSVNLYTGGGTGAVAEPEACAAQSSEAKLQAVYLTFAFDVSGSMGKLDYPYHDPALKWDPVVAATKAFFGDPETAGLNASLAFFPAEEDRCDSENYETPEVPMTPLPSAAFTAAIDAVTPQTEDDWRGGTPTLAVVEGTLAYLAPLVAANPIDKYALVLVTDGYPQGCDDNEISSVAEAVAAAAPTISTYVIGVNNPPGLGGPETLDDLNTVATAGGTEQAFIIATGSPAQTSTDFKAVIDSIRNKSVSCDLEIPPPPADLVFDKEKVNVTYASNGVLSPIGYDQACAFPSAWRYDNDLEPTMIQLCPEMCATVQADAAAVLSVEFGCERRPAEVF